MGISMGKLFFLGLLGLVFAALASAGPFGKKKEEEEERRYTGKQNAELGLKGISESLSNPEIFREVMQMARDPEVMERAKAMMQDPQFKAEADKFLNSDAMQKAMEQSLKAVEEMAKDPKKVALFQKQMEDIIMSQQAEKVKQYNGKQNAQMGMSNMAAAVRDPKAMKETLNMLKDPEVIKEVEAMMKDPMFQAEMRRMTQQPSFQAAVKQAQKMTDEIRNDPKKLKEFQRELESVMGSFTKDEL